MTKLIRISFRGEPALKASIEEYAERNDTTFSKLVRDTLRREFGLLRMVNKKRR